jgi:hypothetical protein
VRKPGRALLLYLCPLGAVPSVQRLPVRPLFGTGYTVGVCCPAALRTVVDVLRSGPIDSRRRAANIVQHASQVGAHSEVSLRVPSTPVTAWLGCAATHCLRALVRIASHRIAVSRSRIALDSAARRKRKLSEFRTRAPKCAAAAEGKAAVGLRRRTHAPLCAYAHSYAHAHITVAAGERRARRAARRC